MSSTSSTSSSSSNAEAKQIHMFELSRRAVQVRLSRYNHLCCPPLSIVRRLTPRSCCVRQRQLRGAILKTRRRSDKSCVIRFFVSSVAHRRMLNSALFVVNDRVFLFVHYYFVQHYGHVREVVARVSGLRRAQVDSAGTLLLTTLSQANASARSLRSSSNRKCGDACSTPTLRNIAPFSRHVVLESESFVGLVRVQPTDTVW